jgi:sodium-dependent phosphate transporter
MAFFLAERAMQEVVTCTTGVPDCDFWEPPTSSSSMGPTCAVYDEEYKNTQGMLVFPFLTGLIMCTTSFGIGANDAANSWATSVGSKAIALKYAVWIAAVFEFLGAVSLGYGVSGKLNSGVSDLTSPDCWACGYCDSQMPVYSAMMLAADLATSIFLLLATFTAMPVSTTHSIVGAIVGGTMVVVGWDCLNWDFDGGLGGIVASWVISPVLAGLLAAAMYVLTRKLIIEREHCKRNMIVGFPLLIGGISLYMVYMILIKANVTKKWENSKQIGISCGCGAIMFVLGFILDKFYIQPRLPSVNKYSDQLMTDLTMTGTIAEQHAGIHVKAPKEAATKDVEESKDAPAAEGQAERRPSRVESFADEYAKDIVDARKKINPHRGEMEPEDLVDLENADRKDVLYMFRYLLVFNAVLESYAHGANDTGNATTAFAASIALYRDGLDTCSKPESYQWIMALGGGFVGIGIIVMGWRVMRTIGENITSVNYQRGFCIEFGSTLSVVIATLRELPVSTTHCQVGGVIGVGLVSFGFKRVEWKLIGMIFLSWAITIPFSGLISAAGTAIGQAILKR